MAETLCCVNLDVQSLGRRLLVFCPVKGFDALGADAA